MSWLYDTVAEEWSKWLPSSAIETVKKGGYYSVMATPKLKLISLNSNFCYRPNFWILMNTVDPGNQLTWLISELDKAEKDGHYVMIISHIPPDSDCLKSWVHNYIRIMERYQHLLVAQYQGHTHWDEIGVLYSNHSGTIKPVGVSYVGPSLTTYEHINPAYRIFTLNGNVTCLKQT